MTAGPALPFSTTLDIPALSAAFRDKSASYKYLWMQAILRAIERGEFAGGVVPIPLLAAHMLDIAKYPLRRFHLSLGWHGHDKVDVALRDLEDAAGWHGLKGAWFDQDVAARYSEVPAFVYGRLVDFAPYRLLTPFFGDALKGLGASAKRRKIICLADERFDSDRPPFYRFSGDGAGIEMHPGWTAYMRDNLEILQGWALWHWCNYLQGRNPNVPAVSQKLAKPVSADLTKQRQFWRWVIGKRAGEIRCIYSGEALRAQNFAVDHYVPWDFIGHDNLWNLAPVKPEANSAKSNSLPNGDYFPEFVKTQHAALSAFCDSGRTEWNALMECYLVDLRLPIVGGSAPALDELNAAYSHVIPPLLQLAENCGFRPGWRLPD